MALTPEQVINKTFQPTKFREGYDQEEVDLFLDEVVAELRRLEKENEELRQRLREAGLSDSLDGSAQTTDSSAGDTGTVAALDTAEDSSVSTPAQDEPTRSTAAEETVVVEPVETSEQDLAPAGDADIESTEAAQEPAVEETVVVESPVAEPAPAASTTDSAQSAAAVIAMAQRLHDEYVSEGKTERARLISEGQVTAESMVAEAEAKRREVLESLDTDKATLESDVEALRSFETAYRASLREHLEARITELEQTPSLEPRDARA